MYLTVSGVVLNREPLGEYDVKLTILTKSEGKIIIRAKGARKLKAKIARHLDLGSYTTLELTRLGDTNLLIGSNGTTYLLRPNSHAHFVAGEKLLALSTRLVPVGLPEPEILSVLLEGLRQVRQSPTDQVSSIVTNMEMKLIQKAGWKNLEQVPI